MQVADKNKKNYMKESHQLSKITIKHLVIG